MIRVRTWPDRFSWHIWFAWYPVTVSFEREGGICTKTTVWFQRVMRIGTAHRGGMYWEYKLL